MLAQAKWQGGWCFLTRCLFEATVILRIRSQAHLKVGLRRLLEKRLGQCQTFSLDCAPFSPQSSTEGAP